MSVCLFVCLSVCLSALNLRCGVSEVWCGEYLTGRGLGYRVGLAIGQ